MYCMLCSVVSRVVLVVLIDVEWVYVHVFTVFFFFKQKTAYERRISDWSSDVCSSDLDRSRGRRGGDRRATPQRSRRAVRPDERDGAGGLCGADEGRPRAIVNSAAPPAGKLQRANLKLAINGSAVGIFA